jgi:dynein heavy chain
VQVLQMRHAVMLIGQTGGGKSVILNTLAHAQSRMGHRTHLSILDPKA